MLISKKSVIVYGIIVPIFWTLFITLIYNSGNPYISHPNIPGTIKSIISVINFIFSPVIAILLPFVFHKRGEFDEIRKSNKNLLILASMFFVITLAFQYINLMQNWIP